MKAEFAISISVTHSTTVTNAVSYGSHMFVAVVIIVVVAFQLFVSRACFT